MNIPSSSLFVFFLPLSLNDDLVPSSSSLVPTSAADVQR